MIGETISHYRVTGTLGVGGMGVVYEAVDLRLDRPAALKFLPEALTGDPEAARRLEREARILAGLNHPNICTVYEVDRHGGAVFMAMERIDGTNLTMCLAREALTTEAIVDIAGQVAHALEAAHAAGVVHRDIKPGNIVINAAGTVKVLDFGLARRFTLDDSGTPADIGSTLPGRPLGTVNYMAPERILQLPVDPRSDLFSLGVVIYEMAAGRLPFGGTSPADTVSNILERAPTPLTAVAPRRPARLERIVSRLLAKRADDRYASAGELRRDLADLAGSEGGFRAVVRRWLP